MVTVREYGALYKQWRALKHNVVCYGMQRRRMTAAVPWLGVSLRVHSRDVHGRHLFKSGLHEGEVTRFLVRYLEAAPQDVVFDLGANIGYYSLLFDRLVADGVAIHSIEAEPRNHGLCVENLAANDARHVTLHQVAVADSAGEAELYLYKESNLGKHSLIPMDGAETRRVVTTTLDALWEDQGFGDRVPSLIKIDIEGGEHAALAGAQQVLSRCPLVVSEFSQKFMVRAGVDPKDHVALMRGAGFDPFEIADDSRLVAMDHAALLGAQSSMNLVWARASAQSSSWWAAVTDPGPE